METMKMRDHLEARLAELERERDKGYAEVDARLGDEMTKLTKQLAAELGVTVGALRKSRRQAAASLKSAAA